METVLQASILTVATTQLGTDTWNPASFLFASSSNVHQLAGNPENRMRTSLLLVSFRHPALPIPCTPSESVYMHPALPIPPPLRLCTCTHESQHPGACSPSFLVVPCMPQSSWAHLHPPFSGVGETSCPHSHRILSEVVKR